MEQTAIVILHEIYGINDFIKAQCHHYQQAGYAVYCPNLIGTAVFSYDEEAAAYDYFMQTPGFDRYKVINEYLLALKKKHRQVVILGFSVGATIAWLCSEAAVCDGIIACYGSRIRDYGALTPACPALLLFAEENFDVLQLKKSMNQSSRLSIHFFGAEHGFMDSFSSHYDQDVCRKAEAKIQQFLAAYK